MYSKNFCIVMEVQEMSRADDYLEYGTEEYWAERIAEDAENLEKEMDLLDRRMVIYIMQPRGEKTLKNKA